MGGTKGGNSDRYPTGVKYEALRAISDVIMKEDRTASMVASSVSALQAKRKVEKRAPSVDSVVASLVSGSMSEADLKKAMKKAGLLK